MDVLVAGDGSIYATGDTAIASGVAALTVRLSAAGKLLWKRPYSGPAGLGAGAYAIAARPGGGIYVAGATFSSVGNIDGLVMRYTPSGERTDFALDGGAGGVTSQEFMDVAVASTKQVVAVGADASGCRVVTYNTHGAIAGALTFPSQAWGYFQAVATDDFGGYYAAGTETLAPGDTKVFSGRGSVLPGGGGWISLWGPAVASPNNAPTAIAVRATTAVVVGGDWTGAGTGLDQFVLGYIY